MVAFRLFCTFNSETDRLGRIGAAPHKAAVPYWPKMFPSPYWFLAFIAAACACILSYSYCWETASTPPAPTFAAPTSNLEFFLWSLGDLYWLPCTFSFSS